MNLKNIRKDLDDIKEVCDRKEKTMYDFIKRDDKNYLLFFLPYLRKQRVNYSSKIKYTKEILTCPELKDYRIDFENECKKTPVSKLKEISLRKVKPMRYR